MSLQFDIALRRDSFELSINSAITVQGITALYGHSGSGKTSFLRCLAGLEHAKGNISFEGSPWQKQQLFIPSHRRHIGYVFQDARLLPHLTVLGNLEYAYQRRHQHDDNTLTVADICQQLKLTELLSQLPATLSGGQQQRVAIGRALLSHPKLILMDEPLSALDGQSRDQILSFLETLARDINTPIIYVSHNMAEISRIADQLLILEQGRIIAQGATMELCHRLDLSLSHEDNAAAIIEGTVASIDAEHQLRALTLSDKQRLWLSSDKPVGSRLRVAIPARDISLTLSHSVDTSILNILKCVIIDIEHTDASKAHSLIKLQLAKHYLLARLTKKSLVHLNVSIGQTVYAQIKTVALLHSQPDSCYDR